MGFNFGQSGYDARGKDIQCGNKVTCNGRTNGTGVTNGDSATQDEEECNYSGESYLSESCLSNMKAKGRN